MINYREILRQHLAAKVASNPLYSLRSLARDIKMSAARLSEILNGKQGLSVLKAISVADALGLEKSHKAFFVASAEYLHSKDASRRRAAKVRLDSLTPPLNYMLLAEDSFQSVADCNHMAVLYLTATDDFKSNFNWMSKRLGLSVEVIEDIVNRLVRLGFLQRTGNQIIPVDGYSAVAGGTPSTAIRQFHESVLLRALSALNSQSIEERDYGTVIVAAAKTDIKKIRVLSKEFRQNVRRILESNRAKDSVYCLSVQFFELTKRR